MNKKSGERLAKVHPALADRIRRTAAALASVGIEIEVVQGLRTYEEQNALYAQGRTAPGHRVTNAKGGQSNHNFGLAVDVCPFENGQPNWDAPHSVWERIGQVGKVEELEWGGDWTSLTDLPHLQLPGLTLAECRILYQGGGLPAVWAKVPLKSSTSVVTEEVKETVATTQTPANTVVTEEHSSSVISTLAGNETVKEIAKSGVTNGGNKLATALASGSLLSAVDSFVQNHWQGLIFAGILILLAVVVWLFVFWHKHQKQQIAAQINADPSRVDIRYE